MAGIGQLFKALALLVPLPVLLVLAALGALFVGPSWLESIRQRQIRGQVRQLVRADADERARIEADLLEMCGERAARWASLADAANHYGRPTLRDLAITRLEELGAKDLVRKWRETDKRKSAQVRDPVEALVRIERMYRSGADARGDESLAAALQQFPDDPDLVALAAKRAAGAPPAE